MTRRKRRNHTWAIADPSCQVIIDLDRKLTPMAQDGRLENEADRPLIIGHPLPERGPR
jgi:hypothetical protein